MRLAFWLLSCWLVLTAGAAVPAHGQTAVPPNIVMMLADDMAWNHAGCYGDPQVHTPNMDRLATEGMRFDAAFTATAMCAPARQQLYTGLFPVRSGAYPNHSRVKPGTKSLVHHFSGLGYRVGLHGKSHVNPKESYPFEIVKEVDEFIGRDPSTPYFLIVAEHSPHAPWKLGDVSQYPPEKLTLPPWLFDNPETRDAYSRYLAEVTDFDDQVGKVTKLIDASAQSTNTMFIVLTEQGPQFPCGKWTCYDLGLRVGCLVRWPGRVQPASVTSAMVQYVDFVPTLLAAAGADPADYDTGRDGAADGGRGFDGRSFLPVLEGTTTEHQELVFGVQSNLGIIAGNVYPVRSVRSKTHKYIRNLTPDHTFQNTVTEGNTKYWKAWVRDAATDEQAALLVRRYRHRPAEEFYDLTKDPDELQNLAAEPVYRQQMDDMKSKLDAWMKQQGDLGVATEIAYFHREDVSPTKQKKILKRVRE